MNRTDTADPNYYHKVVDCQWACPGAHQRAGIHPDDRAGPVRRRLHPQSRVERVSRAFSGRTCDRPCEPACRRGRVDGKPVAICRLKRVAADHKDDITDRLPKIPTAKNGKKVALIGAGPSVTDRGERPDAAGLPVHHLREGAAPGRPDAHQHPRLPPPRTSARRRDRLHREHGRHDELRLAGDEPEAAGRLEGIRRGVRRQRRAEGQGARPARAGTTPIRSSSASSGSSRFTSVTSNRSASAC